MKRMCNIKSITCIFTILALPLFIKSQNKLAKHKFTDYQNAIEITDSITIVYNVSSGYGKNLEFRLDNNIKEENSIWFKLTPAYDTVLTFDIVPNDSTDDYDFIFFQYKSKEQMDSIRLKKTLPDRICFSYNTAKSSSTGLSEYSSTKIIGAGEGGAYVTPVKIRHGETYYLMINYGEGYFKRYGIARKKWTTYI